MMLRKLSTGFASLVAAALVSGVASLPGALAQDAQQPPPGYPPAGPAGYPSVAPTDPNAPNADPNAAPAAYPAPPAGGAPQYTPALQQPAPLPPRNPWLAMGFVGIHSFQGDNFPTGPGLRIGGIGGLRVNDQLSFNGEIVYDFVNPNGSISGITMYNLQVAAAPFYHLQASPAAEVVIGPKLGFYRLAASGSDYYSGTVDSGVNGLVLGANVGAFVRISPLVSIGGMLSFDYEKPLSCSTNTAYGSYGSGCDTSAEPSPKMLSVAAGALF
jgi:hypothetical protein